MNKECIVYPTSRCIRETVAESIESFLPHMITMGEFLSRAYVAIGKIVPDEDLRLLAMHEASDFSGFAALNIERNFFSFIQNSEYLFRFFEELSSEQVPIATLQAVDVYGEYEEHIAILMRLRERYGEICVSKGWSDRIFNSEHTTIQHDFLRNYETITIIVEGYLSRYEIALLRECAKHLEVILHYNTTVYNRKMTARLEEIGFELSEGNAYRLSLRDIRIIADMPLRINRLVTCEVFHTRLSQIGFIKASVEAFVEEGIAPERIAVVLPDEDAALMLKEFDTEGNFNFAMGTSFSNSVLYRELESITLFLDEASVLNRERIRNVKASTIDWFKSRYPQKFQFSQLEELIALMEDADETSIEMIRDELHRFSHLSHALEQMDFRAVFRIFMNRLRQQSIDDTRGGKITVMGLLETRGVAFDGVVIIDFNEGYVPHKSEKDLFLNTKTREYAGLPSAHDRESLQKHYYSMLFNRAKKVAIGCVQNAESVPSRFLLQLGIKSIPAAYRYEEILFPLPSFNERQVQTYESEYDFTAQPLSASGIKTFLSCKRAFYYRYLERIRDHELPRDLSQERDIGNELHSALEKVYKLQERYSSATQIKETLCTLWEEEKSNDSLERYMKRLWIDKLDPFYTCEASRFALGSKVLYTEKEVSVEVEGIKLNGRIDRIDENGGFLEVIDYKSGKYPDTDKEPKESDVDYQLSVYALLAGELGKVARCGYYDLGKGELKFEQFLEAKIAKLREILATMASQKIWNWEMCDDMARCRNCPYTYLCHREVMRGI
ncbi:MAG: PD-(D/E)XK nuclease family protein [Sulfuricurvum sp.]|uniref:PD-(D/E)XK nuclease family protein n=1 Tax=Sulfuricurvum sp. TaxID=2025608 RepID=UPI002630F14E|nr:PD-(D/E)XK nuclease family protein [Sulfuricurvum sp.]MDD5159795.1 PD-(D/E)XK nuclease family protein [Sulfuricurvum sp.]